VITSSARRATTVLLALLCMPAFLPAPLAAQRAPAFGGAEVRLGLVNAENARIGAGIFGEVDAGYLRWPQLRGLVGFSRYVANIDREPGDDEGSYRAQGVWISGRYDLFATRTLAPYVRAGLTLQRVKADAFDRAYGDLLDGTYIGAGASIGARYALDWFGRLSATAELRSMTAGNISNTAFELGIRYQRQGLRAYVAGLDPLRLPEAARRPTPEAVLPPAVAPPAHTQPDPAVAVEDTAARRVEEAERRAQEAEARLQAERAAAVALAEAEAAAEAERAAAADARAAAAEAMLRQGLLRAAAAMRSAAPLVETPTEFVITIAGAAFTGSSATLTSTARSELRVVATVLAGYPGHIISVEGHSAAGGRVAADRRSAERAAAIRAALIAEGVDPLWTSATGWGPVRPTAAGGGVATERVEVRIEKAFCMGVPVAGPVGRLVCEA
jgi:outer membrane protein OmpA-like peptidoglycan-associated protein